MLLCFCFLPCVLLWFLMIAYDCINLTHSPCGIWTMVENWHTTPPFHCDGHNPNIVISSLHRCLFSFAIYTFCIYPERYVDQQASALFFVVFIIIIIFLLGSGYIMKRRCWRPDKNTNLPEIGGGEDVIWAMSQSEHSLLHIFQIKWEIQCDLSAVWNNVCVIRRFDI